MPPNPLYGECIRRAARLLGGYEALGVRLGLSPRLLEHWGTGKGRATEGVFLKVVDILLEAQSGTAAPPPSGGEHRLTRPARS